MFFFISIFTSTKHIFKRNCNSFEKYISKNYGLDTGKIFENKSECILAGYKNAAPLLINLQTNNNFSQNKFKGFITNDDGFVPYMISHYRIASFTCNEMKTILDKVIYEYANYSGRIKIGGPLEIIQIKKDNSVIVLESFQSQNFINYKVFLNSIIDNKIPVTYLYPYSRTKVVAEAKSLLVK